MKKIIMLVLAILITGCASMAAGMIGYSPTLTVETKFDKMTQTWTIRSTQWGNDGHALSKEPSTIMVQYKKGETPPIASITTYLTLGNAFYPTYADDSNKNKYKTALAWTQPNCDKYGCSWVSAVMTFMDWNDIRIKMALNPSYVYRIHGNGYADATIYPCQMWEIQNEINKIEGKETPYEFGGKPCNG